MFTPAERQVRRRRCLRTLAAVGALVYAAYTSFHAGGQSSAAVVFARSPRGHQSNATSKVSARSRLPLTLDLWLAQLQRRRLCRVLHHASVAQHQVAVIRNLERQGRDGFHLIREGSLSGEVEGVSVGVDDEYPPPPAELLQLHALENRIRLLRHQRRLRRARSTANHAQRSLARLRRSPLQQGAIRAAQTASAVAMGRLALGIIPDGAWKQLRQTLTAVLVEESSKTASQPKVWFQRLQIHNVTKSLMDIFVNVVAFRQWYRRYLQKSAIIDAQVPHVSLDDVAGIGPAKAEAIEIIECLMAPARFVGLGAKCPKGLLLTGPPGCGKTLLAKAIASSAAVPFIAKSGADFNNRFAGVGSQLVKELFRAARAVAPAVVLIDELDYIGRRRGEERGGGLETDRSAALTQLLAEMDGFGSGEGVVVIGTTNRADILDKALLRPGRFDRQVRVPLPDVTGRLKILYSHARRLAFEHQSNLTGLSHPVDWLSWAKRTSGFSGADLAGLINEAAMAAAREQSWGVGERHMQTAYTKALVGIPSGRHPSEAEMALTAAHEAGHAVVNEAMRAGLANEGLNPEGLRTVAHVSIVPTGSTGGTTQFSQPDELKRVPESRTVLLALLAVSMGGRAGEELHSPGGVTMGARSDIQEATRLATEMVATGGLSEVIGPRSLRMAIGRYPSQALLRQADEEVSYLLHSALDIARSALNQNKMLHEAVADSLLAKETLDGQEFRALLKEHPVVPVKVSEHEAIK